MTKKQRTNAPGAGEHVERSANRKDSGAGEGNRSGAVDGIGGVGGSSGAGSVRANPRTVGDVSGLDQRHGVETPPMPGAVGRGVGRRGVASDGGLNGMTRGDDNESVPNQEGAGQSDAI
ncbi:MAG: hypothetical protein RLZZ387_3468 [Chloroflexota bacterium]|jgi:hypothetical protein